MTEKELKKLNRYQLLELLLVQTQRADALQEKLEQQLRQQDSRELQVFALGSIAEASLKLSGVFESAQKAADLYLENAQKKAAETDLSARQNAAAIAAEARAQAQQTLENANKQAAEILEAARRKAYTITTEAKRNAQQLTKRASHSLIDCYEDTKIP